MKKVFKSNLNSTSTVTASLSRSRITTSANLSSVSKLNYISTNRISVFLEDLGITWTPNSVYRFVVNDGFVTDSFGQTNPAQTFYYTTNPTLTIAGSIPSPGDIATLDNDYIQLTFNRTGQQILAGTGNFYLYQLTNGPILLKTYNVKTQVTIVNNVVTIDIRGLLIAGATYYLIADNGVIIDYDRMSWSGISTSSSFRFTTAGEPAFHDLISIETSQSSLVANVTRVIFYTVTLRSRSSLTAFGNTVIFIRMNSRSTLSTGQLYQQILGFGRPRTYLANSANAIFATNTPLIDDSNSNGQTYTMVLTCSNGRFSRLTNGSDLNNPWTYSGTKEQINSIISTINFYPRKGYTSDTTISFNVYGNGWDRSGTFNITNSGTAVIPTTIYTFYSQGTNTTQSWYPTVSELVYCQLDYIVVGGGGGGGTNGFVYGGAGGGGGGGQVVYGTLTTIPASPMLAMPGWGGSINGVSASNTYGNAGTTSFFGYSGHWIAQALPGSGGANATGQGGAAGGSAAGGAAAKITSWYGGSGGNGIIVYNLANSPLKTFGSGGGGGASWDGQTGTNARGAGGANPTRGPGAGGHGGGGINYGAGIAENGTDGIIIIATYS